mgnify:FL=1
MSFFVSSSEDFLDLTTDAMARKPEFADRYDAIEELREKDRARATISVVDAARANGFYRVASLQGPIETLAHVLNPDWLKVKSNFYSWLNKHPRHCTYDRRREKMPNQITVIDGKVVL